MLAQLFIPVQPGAGHDEEKHAYTLASRAFEVISPPGPSGRPRLPLDRLPLALRRQIWLTGRQIHGHGDVLMHDEPLAPYLAIERLTDMSRPLR